MCPQKEFQEMEMKEEEAQALLLNGEDMLARCRGEEARQLRDNLQKMKEKAYDTREKAERKRVSNTTEETIR